MKKPENNEKKNKTINTPKEGEENKGAIKQWNSNIKKKTKQQATLTMNTIHKMPNMPKRNIVSQVKRKTRTDNNESQIRTTT